MRAILMSLMIVTLSACGGGGGAAGTSSPPSSGSYTVGGSIAGPLVARGRLIVENDRGEQITLYNAGTFRFTTSYANGSNYAVNIVSQTAGVSCSLDAGTAAGIINGADVATNITCAGQRGSLDLDFGGLVTGISVDVRDRVEGVPSLRNPSQDTGRWHAVVHAAAIVTAASVHTITAPVARSKSAERMIPST